MDISIVIVNHNTADMTLECIESVYRQTTKYSFEIIMVDNNSTDNSISLISDNINGVKIIKNAANIVFAVANNQAIEICQGRYILLLNSDTVILDSAIDRMIQFLDRSPKVGIVGAKMYDAHGKPWKYETWNLSALSYLFGPIKLKLAKDPPTLKVPWVCGACLLIRRTVVDQIGLLDRPMYGEDVDWCLRAGKAGWDIWHLADAKIIHYWGTTAARPDLVTWRVIAGRVSKLYYVRKNNGTLDHGLLYCIMIFESFVKWSLFSIGRLLLADANKGTAAKATGYGRLCFALLTGKALQFLPLGRI
jgi:GT2 family glycosyltransferase